MGSWDGLPPYAFHESRTRRLTAANLLILLNFAGFLATGILTRAGKDPGAVAAFDFEAWAAIGQFELWRFVTYPFVQVVDPLFFIWFALGTYALYTLGNELEAEIGARRFLLFYFSFAAYGAVAHAIRQYAAPGADAARAMSLFAPVAGIVAAAALQAPSRPVLFLFLLPLRTLTVVTALVIAAVLYCALAFPPGLAPVLGAILAATATVGFEPRIDAFLEHRSLRRERDRFLQEIEIRRETERLLEKISREGMDSLTRAELRILRGASELINRERRDA